MSKQETQKWKRYGLEKLMIKDLDKKGNSYFPPYIEYMQAIRYGNLKRATAQHRGYLRQPDQQQALKVLMKNLKDEKEWFNQDFMSVLNKRAREEDDGSINKEKCKPIQRETKKKNAERKEKEFGKPLQTSTKCTKTKMPKIFIGESRKIDWDIKPVFLQIKQ